MLSTIVLSATHGTSTSATSACREKKAAAASPRAVLQKLKASLRGSLKKERAGDLDHLQAESPTILTRASDPRAAGAAEAASTADEAGIFTFQSCQAEASGCDHTEGECPPPGPPFPPARMRMGVHACYACNNSCKLPSWVCTHADAFQPLLLACASSSQCVRCGSTKSGCMHLPQGAAQRQPHLLR